MNKNPIHGWLNINKPVGMGSTDVVRAVKRILRPAKVGHAGTLDPLADGVLPIALGDATKTIQYMQDARKTYEFSIVFGHETTTDDREGEPTEHSDVIPSIDEIEALLPQFTGEIEQVPPAYSALKVNGKRAYDLARAGEEVVLEARKVTIFDLRLLSNEREMAEPVIPAKAGIQSTVALDSGLRRSDEPEESKRRYEKARSADRACVLQQRSVVASQYEDGLCQRSADTRQPPKGAKRSNSVELRSASLEPKAQDSMLHLRATVSKGTYIRSLVRDIARAAGARAHVGRLHRAAVGKFNISSAISLDFLEKTVHISDTLLPIDSALDDIPAIHVDANAATRLCHGQPIPLQHDAPLVRIYCDENLVALAETKRGEWWPKRVFGHI